MLFLRVQGGHPGLWFAFACEFLPRAHVASGARGFGFTVCSIVLRVETSVAAYLALFILFPCRCLFIWDIGVCGRLLPPLGSLPVGPRGEGTGPVAQCTGSTRGLVGAYGLPTGQEGSAEGHPQ
jgi:hypothetical protein